MITVGYPGSPLHPITSPDKDHIIKTVFEKIDDRKEQTAWRQLKTVLDWRLADVRENGASPRTVKDITENALVYWKKR